MLCFTLVQRLEVETGEAAGVSGGVLTGEREVVHSAEQLADGGPGDRRLGGVR